MAKIHKQPTANVGDVEEEDSSVTVGGVEDLCDHYGNQCSESLKSKEKSTIGPSCTIPSYIPKGLNIYRYLVMFQEMETT